MEKSPRSQRPRSSRVVPRPADSVAGKPCEQPEDRAAVAEPPQLREEVVAEQVEAGSAARVDADDGRLKPVGGRKRLDLLVKVARPRAASKEVEEHGAPPLARPLGRQLSQGSAAARPVRRVLRGAHEEAKRDQPACDAQRHLLMAHGVEQNTATAPFDGC